MNKYQEALETIAVIHGVDGLVSQFLDLKELVDRTTPKKPIRIGTYKEDVLCPNCESDYTWISKTVGWEREMVMFPHCAKCSQALDWGKEDE